MFEMSYVHVDNVRVYKAFIDSKLCNVLTDGGLAHMVERSLSM